MKTRDIIVFSLDLERSDIAIKSLEQRTEKS